MPIATLTAMLVMFSTIAGGNTQSFIATSTTYSATAAEAVLVSPIPAASMAKAVELQVRGYYKESPILAEIAFCESRFTQIDPNGNVLRGRVDSDDIGVMQINQRYHGDRAEKLGLDIYTFKGNLAYAKWLYEKEGTAPWRSSEPCWGKYQSEI